MNSKTITAAKSARAEKLARVARLNAISEGLAAETAALNAALPGGAIVCLPTKEENPNQGANSAGKRVVSARFGHDGMWVETANYGGSFAFGNDCAWERLLRVAGVARDPRAA